MRTTCALLAAASLLLMGCGSDAVPAGGGAGASDAPRVTADAATMARTALRSRPVATDLGNSPAARALLPHFFSPASPWNRTVTLARVDPRSRRMMWLAAIRTEQGDGRGADANVRRHVDEGLYVNTVRWTTPIVSDVDGRPTPVFCRQSPCGDAGKLRSLRIPPGVNPDPSYDGWLTLVEPDRRIAWDLWRARRQADGSLSFQFGKRWRLDGMGFGPPGSVSARGSGLPLFAGVMTLQELRRGRIDHALAISLPAPARRRYVSPASATDGVGPLGSVPEGARLRLRPGVVVEPPEGTDRDIAMTIARTLKTYGAIVVDRSATPTLYAQKDVTAGLLRGDELRSVRLADFAVIRLGHVRETVGAVSMAGER